MSAGQFACAAAMPFRSSCPCAKGVDAKISCHQPMISCAELRRLTMTGAALRDDHGRPNSRKVRDARTRASGRTFIDSWIGTATSTRRPSSTRTAMKRVGYMNLFLCMLAAALLAGHRIRQCATRTQRKSEGSFTPQWLTTARSSGQMRPGIPLPGAIGRRRGAITAMQ